MCVCVAYVATLKKTQNVLVSTFIEPWQLCGSGCVCDYSLQGLFAQAYGACVAYVATLKKTPTMGVSIHASNHDNPVGLNVCVTTACKAYDMCVSPVWPHSKKTRKMALSLHALNHDSCVGLSVSV